MYRARLVLVDEQGNMGEEYALDKPFLKIGRSDEADIVIPSDDISRVHAQITKNATDYFLTDLYSTNGSFINSQQIKPNVPTKLKSNDQINLGVLTLMFQLVPSSVPPVGKNYSQEFNDEYPSSTPFSKSSFQEHPYASSYSSGQTNKDQGAMQPIYIPPSGHDPVFTAAPVTSQPALSDEEKMLADEIFGNAKPSSKASQTKFASWEKMNLFRQKIDLVQQNDLSDDELFDKIMGGGSTEPKELSNYSISHNQVSVPAIAKDFQHINLQAEEPPAPAIEIPSNVSTSNEKMDPFEALQYQEDQSILKDFKGNAKEFFHEKFQAFHHEEKPNLQTILKNYALPMVIIGLVVLVAIFMWFRNSGVFG
jgi:predicted component of type VI protein secretion system